MYMLSIAFAIIIVNCHVVKADVTELQQDDKGRYCISTADDYYFFENNCDNNLYYKSTVVLTNDIEIINKEKTKDASIVCAKAADELLTISDITASFVLGYMEDKRICISGRSIGDINVQVILEKLRRRRTYYPCRSTSRRNDNGRSKTRTNNKNK